MKDILEGASHLFLQYHLLGMLCMCLSMDNFQVGNLVDMQFLFDLTATRKHSVSTYSLGKE